MAGRKSLLIDHSIARSGDAMIDLTDNNLSLSRDGGVGIGTEKAPHRTRFHLTILPKGNPLC
jgi:hypothetical protein